MAVFIDSRSLITPVKDIIIVTADKVNFLGVHNLLPHLGAGLNKLQHVIQIPSINPGCIQVDVCVIFLLPKTNKHKTGWVKIQSEAHATI